MEDNPLASLLELLTRVSDLPDMLDQAAALFADGWQADGALIWQVIGGEIVATSGYPSDHADPTDLGNVRMPVGSGVVGRVAAEAVPVSLIDDNPRNLAHRRLLGLPPGAVVSRLCVPARLPSGDVVAVVALHQHQRRVFTPGETALCQRAADLLALRIGLDTAAASEAAQIAVRDGLVAATVTAQETERRRVAADLHDGVSQAIAGLTFHLSAAATALADGDTDYAGEQVAAARALADLAMGETRAAITGLHSPVIDDLGLAAGLASMARVIPNLDIEVAADDIELPAAVTTSLFRIAQEAVQNVVKHAHARHASIQLTGRGASVVLSISDDGDGFAAPLGDGLSAGAAAGHYGLAGMAERARLISGNLTVRSAPGEGTMIEVTVSI